MRKLLVSTIKWPLSKIRCRPGWWRHVWSDWGHETEGSCRQMKVCRWRGESLLCTQHEWTEWRSSRADSCTETSTCCRCGQEKERIAHGWTEWKYADPDVLYVLM